ncbi:hypothetical protein H0H92_005421 [Tricholoma furcatifolium]|nr:hypothetical protein H0H92_005421 [Tricholoma furcatifolium]
MLDQSDVRGAHEPYPTDHSTSLKRAPEASPAKSRGEQRRPQKISRLNLSEEADPSTDKTGDSLTEQDLSPISSPTRTHEQTKGLPLPNPNESSALTPKAKEQVLMTNNDSPLPAPPYTQAATTHAYPQPQVPRDQDTPMGDGNPNNPNDTEPTVYPDPNMAQISTIPQTNDAPVVPQNQIPKDLHFHKTTTAQHSSMPETQTVSTPNASQPSTALAHATTLQQTPSDANESQDAMTVDSEDKRDKSVDTPRDGAQPTSGSPLMGGLRVDLLYKELGFRGCRARAPPSSMGAPISSRARPPSHACRDVRARPNEHGRAQIGEAAPK